MKNAPQSRAFSVFLMFLSPGDADSSHPDPSKATSHPPAAEWLDLSRFDAAPSARLSHFPFESDVALADTSRHSVFILTNERGTNRWSYRGASQAVRNVRERIGALDYDIHSWRYNAACELVEAGCGDDLVAAITGQSPAMVLHYTKKVRQKIRVAQAQQMRTEQKRFS